MKWLETQFWKFAKWLIRRGYGAKCPTKDYEDYPELNVTLKTPHSGRCASCEAAEVIEWIDHHIELINL